MDEEGNKYVFHRVTHSKTSGGRNNWKITPNPIDGSNNPMYIVKQEQKDNKKRFSVFQIKTKKGVDVSYPEIKKLEAHRLNRTAQKLKPAKPLNQTMSKKANKKLEACKPLVALDTNPAQLLNQSSLKM